MKACVERMSEGGRPRKREREREGERGREGEREGERRREREREGKRGRKRERWRKSRRGLRKKGGRENGRKASLVTGHTSGVTRMSSTPRVKLCS